jgi:ornithine carbamoyltransferase
MNLLEIKQLSPQSLRKLIEMGLQKPDSWGSPLSGKTAALIFEKPSARTRHSSEAAIVQLGGHPVYTRGDEVGMDVRESVEDITRVLAGYHAILAARVFDHGTLRRMAAVSSIPVVNLLSDVEHPLQAIADVITMSEEFGDLSGKSVAWVGDFNNVARSLSWACALLGMHVRLACPAGYDATDEELQGLLAAGASSVEQYRDARLAVEGAVAVHTDTWTSMGQEEEREIRLAVFSPFQVTAETMSNADPRAIFMHCLPAHRGEEVSAEVIDGAQSRVIRQAHHRLSSARAAFAWLVGQGGR